MSISVLENENGECDELISHLKKREQWHRRKMRCVHGTENYRMGYGSGLDGFDPGEDQITGYEAIYPDYAKGWRDGLRAFDMAESGERPITQPKEGE